MITVKATNKRIAMPYKVPPELLAREIILSNSIVALGGFD
jgi:hypothetical protein